MGDSQVKGCGSKSTRSGPGALDPCGPGSGSASSRRLRRPLAASPVPALLRTTHLRTTLLRTTLLRTALLAIAALTSCARPAPPPAAPAPAPAPARPRIAVLSAFQLELDALRHAATITETRVINGRTHYLGTLEGQEVVLALSGFSVVNAAMTTQALLDRVPVRAIVFSGIAGGVNPSLHVGDVTVPAQWGNYQEMVFARETATGFAPARVTTPFPNFGMMYPQGTSVTVRGGTADSLARRFWFPADSAALGVARTVAATVALARCTPDGACLAHAPRVVVGGNGVSGPTFVDNARFREWAWSAFQADALDMETAAVAVVAYENRVPYIAFRSLSDLAGGGEGANEVPVFGRLAAQNAAAVVRAYLRALPPARP